MTEVSYGSVRFSDIETVQVSQEQQFDEGGVDPLYIKTDVTVVGVAHVQTTNPHLGADVGSDLASGLSLVERLLLTPRRRFTMKINGSTYFDVLPTAVEPGVRAPTAKNLIEADVNNGPKTRLEVSNIISGKSAKVRMTFTLARPNCNTANTNGILSMRWWVSDIIDCSTWLTSRRYDGFLRVASRNVSPHAFRNFVLPPLVTNFKRSGIEFRESEDGLTLRFTITDDEWCTVPPSPCTDFEGDFTVSSPKGNGCIWYADINFTLKAPRNVSKQTMRSICKKILDAQIDLSNRYANDQLLIENIAFRKALGKVNRVSCNARVMYIAGEGEIDIFNMVKRDFDDHPIPGISSTAAANPFPTASLKGILLAHLQTGCSPNSMGRIGTMTSESQAKPVRQDDSDTIVIDAGHIEAGDTLLDLDLQQQNPITHYRLTNDYRVKGGRISLPTGKASRAGEATSAVISLHRGSATRTVRIEGNRMNKQPPMPSTADFTDENGIRHSLIDWRPMPSTAVVSADGLKTLHLVDGEYTYALSRAPTSADDLPIGNVPYLQRLPVEKQTYPANEYVSAQSLLTSKRGLVARR